MTKSNDDELLALADAVRGRQKIAEGPKERLTILVSTVLKERLQLVYGKRLGRMFEEEMLARLIREGHLGPQAAAGGGADAYFNPKTPTELVRPAEAGKHPQYDPVSKSMEMVDDEEGG